LFGAGWVLYSKTVYEIENAKKKKKKNRDNYFFYLYTFYLLEVHSSMIAANCTLMIIWIALVAPGRYGHG
jgi:hypothetical protein